MSAHEVIYEAVVSTVDGQGRPHHAPMGVRYLAGAELLLMPFRPSTTLDNLLATRSAAVNLLTDTRVFAGCVTGRRQWPSVPMQQRPGVRLQAALRHLELELLAASEDPQRPVLRLAVRHEQTHAPFLGLNRAQAAVVEGAVLVSRLRLLPIEKIEAEMAYLQIAIDKTAAEPEREAWAWLQAAVAEHRALQSARPEGVRA